MPVDRTIPRPLSAWAALVSALLTYGVIIAVVANVIN